MANPFKAVIFGGIVKVSDDAQLVGQKRFFVDVHMADGGVLGVWDGPTLHEARAAAQEWGVPVIDTISAA